jgi:hypothetical protein
LVHPFFTKIEKFVHQNIKHENVTVVLSKPAKKSAKSGKVPLYVRVIQNGKKSEGRLYHAELTEKEILQWNEPAMRLSN